MFKIVCSKLNIKTSERCRPIWYHIKKARKWFSSVSTVDFKYVNVCCNLHISVVCNSCTTLYWQDKSQYSLLFYACCSFKLSKLNCIKYGSTKSYCSCKRFQHEYMRVTTLYSRIYSSSCYMVMFWLNFFWYLHCTCLWYLSLFFFCVCVCVFVFFRLILFCFAAAVSLLFFFFSCYLRRNIFQDLNTFFTHT